MLQEAWRTLVITITSSELQQALTVELLDVFFKLAGTPACQSLEDSLIFRADFNDQVIGPALAAVHVKKDSRGCPWVFIGRLQFLPLNYGIDASSGMRLVLLTAHTLQKGAGLAAKVRSAAKHANGSSSPSSLYIGGLANGSNASTARRAAGEALAIAALQIQGKLKCGRGSPPLVTMPSGGAAARLLPRSCQLAKARSSSGSLSLTAVTEIACMQ